VDKLVPSSIADLARLQAGVLSRAQLREHGIGDKAERAQLVARRWTAYPPNAVALQNGPPSRLQT